jgi:hypothetical protein
MLTALILICAIESTPDLQSCTRDTAVDAILVPEAFANPAMCFMRGQAYLADTSLGRDLRDNERVKVVCVRQATAPAPSPAVVGSALPAFNQR